MQALAFIALGSLLGAICLAMVIVHLIGVVTTALNGIAL